MAQDELEMEDAQEKKSLSGLQRTSIVVGLASTIIGVGLVVSSHYSDWFGWRSMVDHTRMTRNEVQEALGNLERRITRYIETHPPGVAHPDVGKNGTRVEELFRIVNRLDKRP